MKFTEDQRKLISSFFKKHNVRSSCTMCPDGKYYLTDELFNFPMLTNTGDIDAVRPNKTMPCVFTMCSACGNIQMFAASSLGLRT